MRLVKANQATASKRRVYFHLVDGVDGITAETGEAGGQPQISTNGGAWTNTGIGTLSAIGNGRYYADPTQAAVATTGDVIETRYKSSSTAESPGDSLQVVAFDPDDAVALGLSALSGGTAPTAAAIATAVWTDLTAGSDFSTTDSIGAKLKLFAVATTSGGVTLANGVAHGGTPGSSTATLALKSARIDNSSGTALTIRSTNFGSSAVFVFASGGDAMTVTSTGGGGGLNITAAAGPAMMVNTTASDTNAVQIQTTNGNADAVYALGAGTGAGFRSTPDAVGFGGGGGGITASDVWAYDTRTLTDRTDFSLTTDERTAIANEVETQIIDETDSEKVLTAITDKIASVNPSLSGLTLSAIATSVWANGTRTITGGTVTTVSDKTGYSISGTKTTLDALNDASVSAIATQITTDHGSGSYLTGGSGLTQADVRTAVGLASANLDTQLAGIGVAPSADAIADTTLRRTMANVEVSAHGDSLSLGSLYGLIQMAQEARVIGTTMTIKQTDGTTTLGTKVLIVSAGASPITGIS